MRQKRMGIPQVLSVLAMVIMAGVFSVAIPIPIQARTVSLEESESVNQTHLSKDKVNIVIGKKHKLQLVRAVGDVTWSTNNRRVAIVSPRGEVEGVREGYATITAKCDGISYKCEVTVDSNMSVSDKKFMKSLYRSAVKLSDSVNPGFVVPDGNLNLQGQSMYSKSVFEKYFLQEKTIKKIYEKYSKDKRAIYYGDKKKTIGVMICKSTLELEEDKYYVYYGNIKDGKRQGKGCYMTAWSKSKNSPAGYMLMYANSTKDYANGKSIIYSFKNYQKEKDYKMYYKEVYEISFKNGLANGKGKLGMNMQFIRKDGNIDDDGVDFKISFKNGKPQRAKKPSSAAFKQWFSQEGGYTKWLSSHEGKNNIIIGYGEDWYGSAYYYYYSKTARLGFR